MRTNPAIKLRNIGYGKSVHNAEREGAVQPCSKECDPSRFGSIVQCGKPISPESLSRVIMAIIDKPSLNSRDLSSHGASRGVLPRSGHSVFTCEDLFS
ncbi:hypothetical protein, partial [Mesorhizobium sp.]|uniref:hypothetical protein n=1 Tax=Mesorhizobium sp. TaxID=1871066 RepID=UPI0025EEDBA7